MSTIRCGVDVGSTLIKVAVSKDGKTSFFSTRDMTKEKLIEELQSLGVAKVHLTGIGKYDLPFQAIRSSENPIKHEIDTQVAGTQHLMKEWADKHGFEQPTEYCLIAAGTGASFTSVEKLRVGGKDDYWVRLPFGSAFAGGFLSKIANHLYSQNHFKSDDQTLKDLDGMAIYAMNTNHPTSDLMLSDIDPSVVPGADLLVASCGKLPPPYPWRQSQQLALALIDMVATALLDKYLMYRHYWVAKGGNITLIGSLAAMPSFQMAFRRLALPFGLISYFPPNGEYAGALGAMLAAPLEEEKQEEKQVIDLVSPVGEAIVPFSGPLSFTGFVNLTEPVITRNIMASFLSDRFDSPDWSFSEAPKPIHFHFGAH